jgi:hypothetical protein
MASFLRRAPHATTGPVGLVHSVNLSEYGVWPGPLKEDDKAKLLINMHDYFFPTEVDRSLAIREIINKRYFADIKTHLSAPRRIFKHLKKEHADSLCERGEPGLGPLNYYTTIDTKKIADEHEGLFLTYAEGARYSIASVSGAGNHVLVYCTTTDLNAQFGYDACVEISQPECFSRAIASTLVQHFKGRNELVRAEHAKCAYQHTRIISGRLHGFSEALIQLGELSVDTIDVLSDKKYLIKESTYRKDSEYRFAFVTRTDVPEYTVIRCPEATKFYRRITNCSDSQTARTSE